MTRQKQLIFPLISILLCFTPLCHGQAWSGILDPSRAADWTNAGIPGGIPTRSTICTTLSAGASSSQINAAIAACPSGQVVFLNAGTYSISGGINFNGHSNVTLRGAGPTQTVLQFSSGDGCGGQGGDVCMSPASPVWVGSASIVPGGNQAANWTAGYARGTTTITLSSTPSGLAAGSMLILDQANDTSDNGGFFVCDVAGICHQSSETGSSDGRTVNGVDRNQTQIVTVEGVSGNQVTISPGLYMNNWRSSQSPGAWVPGQLNQAGLENLTVDNSSSGNSINSGIYLYSCYECWVKNVRSIKGNRNHIWVYQSAKDVIRDSYFYGTQNAAQESYGVETFISSDILVENNIFQQIASPIMSGSGEGNVVAYNFSIDDYYNVSAGWMQNTYANHDAGNYLNLFEGNEFNAIDCDNIHGTGGLTTDFRNQLTGSQSGKSSNTHAMNLYSFCRGYNIIGNVLGTHGVHTTYEVGPGIGSSGNCDSAIYDEGFQGVECAGLPSDPLVHTTLLRWGNWDAANNSTQWNSSEIPTSGVLYINGNPVPSSQTLPSSFYLSSRPSWWGSMPWPAIGPDVTGGSDYSTHVYANPAQVCYTGSMQGSSDGSGNVLSFDASTCYSSSVSSTPAPAPPSNLTVTVQ